MKGLHSWFRAFGVVVGFVGGLGVAPALAAAQEATPAISDTLRLTDEQKAEVLGRNTEDSVDAARAGLSGEGSPKRQIHGEIGAMIGTGGARGIYGAAAIPIGDHAGATVSFESSRFGYPR